MMNPMLVGALKSGSIRLADATDVGFAVLKPLPDASSGWLTWTSLVCAR